MRIEWSEDALGDLREIISYVSSSFGGRKAIEVFWEIRDAVNDKTIMRRIKEIRKIVAAL